MADRHPCPRPPGVVMGASGSRKTTAGAALAERLCPDSAAVDAFHSEANLVQTAAGHAWTSAPGEDAQALAPFLEGRRSRFKAESPARRNGTTIGSLARSTLEPKLSVPHGAPFHSRG